MKKHVLVCDEHKTSHQNKDILEHYKSRCISRHPVPTYSKEIKLSFHSKNDDHSDNNAIFMLQTIMVNNKRYTIFFDNGCFDFISKFQVVKQLGDRAHQEYSGAIQMGGVGGMTCETSHGIYSVKLPMINGNDATMTGTCMDRITLKFPMYQLNGDVINDIRKGYSDNGGNLKNLPSVPDEVGGEIDFMIGIKYLRYFPEFIFKLPSGLTIYKSCFKNFDGSTGVIGGPHEIFNGIEENHQKAMNFIKSQHQLFTQGYHVNPDVRLLGYTNQKADIFFDSNEDKITQKQHMFQHAENAGSEFTFRCVNCRGCETCKDLSSIEEVMSIKEEVEQDLINRSVKVDAASQTSTALLPLIKDPLTYLAPNREVALKVYTSN